MSIVGNTRRSNQAAVEVDFAVTPSLELLENDSSMRLPVSIPEPVPMIVGYPLLDVASGAKELLWASQGVGIDATRQDLPARRTVAL